MSHQKNIIDKIWDMHVVASQAGAPDVFFIDLQLLHEVTSPQAFKALKENKMFVFAPHRQVATIDHSIPTDPQRKNYADDLTRKQVQKLKDNCHAFGIKLYDVGSGHQGIVHVMGPELGLTQPGMTIVCGDSHTSTHGAFGALAFGIGTTQINHVLATSCLLLERPKTMKVVFSGTPSQYFTAKDAILALIQQIGVQGGNGHIMEYCGDFVEKLGMEGRMTMCNMSIECGARGGLVSPDATTLAWLRSTKYGQEIITNCASTSLSTGSLRMTNKNDTKPGVDGQSEIRNQKSEILLSQMEAYWLSLASDSDSTYDTTVHVDLTDRQPLVTWGTTPAQSVEVHETIPKRTDLSTDQQELADQSLEYTQLKYGQPIAGTPIQNVFIGSCTNSRLIDLEAAAAIIKGHSVAAGVKVRVVPGSEQVRAAAEAQGLDTIFTAAGCEWRHSGCSSCLAMNGDHIAAGERCASTSNRNFVGRQGSGAITHLMSPQMAAIAAVTGKITNPEEYFNSNLKS